MLTAFFNGVDCLPGHADFGGEVERILRKTGDEDGYVFEVMRHADLAEALGISAFGVGASFGYITEAGELPEGLEEEDLIKVT